MVEDIVVPGAWRIGYMGGKLNTTVVDWIERAVAETACTAEARP